MTFDRKAFESQLSAVASRYEKTAPTVEAWCDLLASAPDTAVTLADVHALDRLHTDTELPACMAANMIYHLNSRLGRDTTGHAGF